jgi:hypothetical protein
MHRSRYYEYVKFSKKRMNKLFERNQFIIKKLLIKNKVIHLIIRIKNSVQLYHLFYNKIILQIFNMTKN